MGALIRDFDRLDELLGDELRILTRPTAPEASAGILLHLMLAALRADARVLIQAVLNPDYEIPHARTRNSCYIRNLRNSNRPGVCCEELSNAHTLTHDLILAKFVGRPKPIGIFVIQQTLTQDEGAIIAAAEAAGAECCLVYVKANELFGQQAATTTAAGFLLRAKDMIIPPKLQRSARPLFVISDRELLRARRQRRNCCQFDEARFMQWIMLRVSRRKSASTSFTTKSSVRRVTPPMTREEQPGASDTPRIKGPRSSRSYEASAFDGPPPDLQRLDAEREEKMLISALRERRESFKSRSSSHPTLVKDEGSVEDFLPHPDVPLGKASRVGAASPVSLQTWQEELNARAFARYQNRDKSRGSDIAESNRRKRATVSDEPTTAHTRMPSSTSLLRSSHGSSRSHSSLFGEPPARTHSIFGVQETPSSNRSSGRIRDKLKVMARLGISRKRI